jgi:RHS repeat-associated protein
VVVNSLGVVAAQLFAPYGQARWAGGTMPTSYAFTGQRADSTTGLDYYVARYYDPVAGIFTSADTVLPGGGYDPAGLDHYAYVEDNPETRQDVDGHCWPFCAITAAVGAAIGFTADFMQQINDGNWSVGAWERTFADTALGAGAGFLMGTGFASAAGVGIMTGLLLGGIGVIAGTATPQDAFESAALGGIFNAFTPSFTGPVNGGDMEMAARAFFQGIFGMVDSGMENTIQQHLAMMSGEQASFDPTQFYFSIGIGGAASFFAQFGYDITLYLPKQSGSSRAITRFLNKGRDKGKVAIYNFLLALADSAGEATYQWYLGIPDDPARPTTIHHGKGSF